MGSPATAAVRLLAGEREPTRAATTANITLAGLQTVDGVALNVNDRVLVKNQTDARQNGIYTASEGPWARASDASFSRSMTQGVTVQVQQGGQGGRAFRFATKDPRIGIDAIQIAFYLSASFAADAENVITAQKASLTAFVDTTVADASNDFTAFVNSTVDAGQAEISGTAAAVIAPLVEQAEAARDIAAGYASDIVSQGNVPIYDSRSAAAAYDLAGILSFIVNRDVAGAPIAPLRYVPSEGNIEPTHSAKFQAAGKWYEAQDTRIEVEAVGGRSDGSNAAPAIRTAAILSLITGGVVHLREGRTYTIGRLDLGDLAGVRFAGTGKLRHNGSVTSGDIITLGPSTKAETIDLSMPGHGNGIWDVRIGNGSTINVLTVKADTQSQGETVVTTGQDVEIGYFTTVNVDRPLHVDNQAGSSLTSGFKLGFYNIKSYMRAIRLSAIEGYEIGRGWARGRSPNALNESPGYNVLLLTSARLGTVADATWEDSGEHSFRIGGNVGPGAVDTTDVQLGDLTIKRCSASPIKINPNYTARAKRISFGDILVVDGGFTTGTTAKRSDGLRLSHYEDVTVRSIRFVTEQLSTSCETAYRLNNGRNLRIGFIDARFVESGLGFWDQTADVDSGQGATQGGTVTGVYIDRFVGVKGAGTYPFSFNMPNHQIGNVRINGLRVDGLTTGLAAFAAGQVLGGIVEMTGTVSGAGAFAFSNLPDSDNFRVDLTVDGSRLIGPVRHLTRVAATMVVAGDPFDPANGVAQLAALDIMTQKGVAGVGNYGAGVAFHGAAASGRRRAAIAPKQTGANGHNVGLSFLTNAGVGGSDALVETFLLKAGGGVIAGLPTFASNAAAVSAGLSVNDWYKTATGELRIVV